MYAFVHIEKTGGSTLLTVLRRSFGARHCDIRLPLAKRRLETHDQKMLVDADDLRRVRRLYRSLCSLSGHNVKAYSDLHCECPAIRFISIVRDPVARFRSHYLNRCPSHTPADFENWIGQQWLHNWQTKMIAGEPSAERAMELIQTRFGFVGLTERFDESLVLLGVQMGEPDFRPAYRPANRLSDKNRPRDVARRNSDMSYLDHPDTIARIRAANVEDQKVYDFVTASIYPRQVALFQGDLAVETARLQELNSQPSKLTEPWWGAFKRNYVYKPLIHCYAM